MENIEDNLVIKLYRDGSKLNPKIPSGVSRREIWLSLVDFWDHIIDGRHSDFGDEIQFSGRLASRLGVEFLEKYFIVWARNRASKKYESNILILIICGELLDSKTLPSREILEIALNKSSVVRKVNKFPIDFRNAMRSSIIFSMYRAWSCVWPSADRERIELMNYLCLFTYGREDEMSSSDRECLERMLGEDVVSRVVKRRKWFG